MFLLIAYPLPRPYGAQDISIHLMFLLIYLDPILDLGPKSISIHLMFLLILDSLCVSYLVSHFNTSHVSINLCEAKTKNLRS